MAISTLTTRAVAVVRPPLTLALLTAGGALLVLVAIVLSASADTPMPLVNGLLRGAIVAAPLVAAVYAFREPGCARFGRLLVLVGLVSFVSTLGESPDAGLYTIGRIAGWTVELLLVLLVLSYPSGRLEARVDRVLAAAMTAVYALLFLPTVVISPSFATPSPWTSCTQHCPPNALFAFDHALLGRAPQAIAGVALFSVLLGVVVRLQHRVRDANTLQRQMLLPLLAVGIVHTTLIGCGFLWRLFDTESAAIRVAVWLIALSIPLLSTAFLVGLVRTRLFAERALVGLTAGMGGPPDAHALQRRFAAAFADPALEIWLPAPSVADGWIDADGCPAGGDPGVGRRLCVVHARDGTPVAGLVCDVALAEHPSLLEAATAIAAVAAGKRAPRRRSGSCRPRGTRNRAPGSPPPRTARDGGSSAICTTERNSGWSRCASSWAWWRTSCATTRRAA